MIAIKESTLILQCKAIWRPFQEKKLYNAEIGTDTTNIGERNVEEEN